MNVLPLPGLKGTEPIGFLAAVGLLRILDQRRSFGEVKLAWSDDPGWSAVLHTREACDEDQLINKLLDHMHKRADFPVFAGVMPDGNTLHDNPWDDVKVPLEHFGGMLVALRGSASRCDREPADFYSAFASELISLGNKDVVKPSALHMTSGNQKFLDSARELARSLDPHEERRRSITSPADAFREAVFARSDDGGAGWRAKDEFSAMGFDPSREAVYALSAAAPTNTGPRSTRAAVWFALEAFPLFTVHPSRGRLHTRGFDRRATKFHWPIWDGALNCDVLRTALGVDIGFNPEATNVSLTNLGIRAIMQAERVTIGQGYGQLRPAIRLR